MLEQKLERLAAAHIEMIPVPGVSRHVVLGRDGFASLVECSPEGFGAIGAPGLVSERGFAVLVWRGEIGFFVARGFEQQATTEQVEALRKFSRDLSEALA
jgi:hypothetical protein